MFIHDLTNKSVIGMHSGASQLALALAIETLLSKYL